MGEVLFCFLFFFLMLTFIKFKDWHPFSKYSGPSRVADTQALDTVLKKTNTELIF